MHVRECACAQSPGCIVHYVYEIDCAGLCVLVMPRQDTDWLSFDTAVCLATQTQLLQSWHRDNLPLVSPNLLLHSSAAVCLIWSLIQLSEFHESDLFGLHYSRIVYCTCPIAVLAKSQSIVIM